MKKVFCFIPSLITFCSLLCGLWSIFITVFFSKIDIAICLIVISGILDGFDGRVARFLGVNGNFGIELDSLCDFLNFGVAPVFIVFRSFNWDNIFVAFAILTFFSVCMALRLARFNMLALQPVKNQKLADLRKKFFFGFAAPIGAITLMMPIIVSLLGYQRFFCGNCILLYTIFVALLLVFPVPIFGHKSLHFGKKKKIDIIFTISTIALILFFIRYPLKCVFIVFVCYICTIPVSTIVYLKNKRNCLN